MNVQPGTATAIIAAVVALVGTAVTFINRNRDSTDKRLDTLFDANEALVGQLQVERAELRARVEVLERDRDVDRAEMRDLRETASGQAMEMYVLRQREADMRVWMSDIMAWAAMAVGVIRGMGAEIEDPPTPPLLPVP